VEEARIKTNTSPKICFCTTLQKVSIQLYINISKNNKLYNTCENKIKINEKKNNYKNNKN